MPAGGRTEPGTVLFDRYRVVRRIAAGGMGTVFEARDLVLDQPVALKRVSYAALPDELAAETRERTLREARNAAQMRGDPHVVAIYDVQVSDDDVWLVLEYLPSRSLAELTAGHTQLDVRTVAGIGAPVARGLAAAHGRGITHRDVKPGNILIATDGGAAKLTDFGISHAEGESTLTATGQVSGTPAYMAREVARGDDATSASDVFSLGATLYAAVEGIGPFGPQSNPRAMVYRVANDPVRPPEVAGPLAPMLMAMMADEPSQRPDATTVAGWLESVATQPESRVEPGPGRPGAGVAGPTTPLQRSAGPVSPGGGTPGPGRPGQRSWSPAGDAAPESAAPGAAQRPGAPGAGPGSGSPQPGTSRPGSPAGAPLSGAPLPGAPRPDGRQASGSPGGGPAALAGGRAPGPVTPHPGAVVPIPQDHPARAAQPPGSGRPEPREPAGPMAQNPAGPVAPRSGGRTRRRRTPLLVAGAVGAVLLVVLGVVGFRMLTTPDAPAPVAAVSPRAISGDPRTADPCPLLDPVALQRFGGVSPSPAGAPAGCRTDITASDGKPAQLTASFGRGVTVDGGTQQVYDLTVQRGRTEDGEGSRSCTHSVVLPDGNQVLLRAYSFTSAIPPCDLADQGLDSAVATLRRDGVRYDPDRNQGVVLARADACQVLDAAALGRVGIGAAAFPGFASWSCSWGTSDNYASVSFGGTTERTGVAGTPGPPVSGHKSWVDGTTGRCSVIVAHREPPGRDDLMETVTTTVQAAAADRDRTCAVATDLATTAESRLPSG